MLRSVFRNFQWGLTGFVNFLTVVSLRRHQGLGERHVSEAITAQFAVDGKHDLVG
jgi:hypothetical protein